MLRRSWGAGVLFLTAIAVGGRTLVALGAIEALVVATAIGRDRQGLSGFNALLVGCAAFTLLSPATATQLLMLGAALLTLPLKRMLDWPLSRLGLPSLTLPFILATWLMLAVAPIAGVAPYAAEAIAETPSATPTAILQGWSKGLSQVFLLDSWPAGLLIMAGLWLSDRRAALWAATGSALGMGFAAACGCPFSELAVGLWGFSPALTAVALARRRPAAVVAAIALTVLIQLLLRPTGLPALTLPFCLATLIADFCLKNMPIDTTARNT